MKGFLNLILAMAVGTLLVTSTPADAKIFKCVAAGGGVTYSQTACPTEEKTSKVLEGKSVQERFNCSIIRAFSKQVAEEMMAGVASDDLFLRYGGIDTMAPTSVSVVSYVYGHKGNNDSSINRIVALSGARCESGAYSQDTDCQHFPPSFIDSAGGCAAVKGESAQASQTSEPTSAGALAPAVSPGSLEGVPELGGALPRESSVNSGAEFAEPTPSFNDKSLELKNYNVLKDSVAEIQTKCRQAIMDEIRTVQTKMRRDSMTIDERNDLNDKRAGLRDRFETC